MYYHFYLKLIHLLLQIIIVCIFSDLDECEEATENPCPPGYLCDNNGNGRGYCCIPHPAYYTYYNDGGKK